jgi:hypothetical protein
VRRDSLAARHEEILSLTRSTRPLSYRTFVRIGSARTGFT